MRLEGSDCARATRALQAFTGAPDASAQPTVNGEVCDLQTAVAAAARILFDSRQPLFGGLGTDVAGARALYPLACETGAISDAAQGEALMRGLRALQDRGSFTTTTIAEVRTRADLIVCFGGSPALTHPEFFRRCGLGEDTVPQREVVILGAASGEDVAATVAALNQLPGVRAEAVDLAGDLFSTASLLAALVAGKAVPKAPASLDALAARLRAAHYAVIAWENAALPEQGALIIETLNHVVGLLNRSTRAAGFPLGGGLGAATVNQVFSWLSGVPLRSRAGPDGLEHEPLLFGADRLLRDRAVDAVLWISSFSPEPAPLDASLPAVLVGHPDLAARTTPGAPGVPRVFIPVSTPGIGSTGHLFRADGVVLMPLDAVRADSLPTAAQVFARVSTALSNLKQEARA